MFQNFFNYKLINKENSGVIWNEQLEIVFVLEGEGTLILDGTKKYHSIKKSDIFVINGYHPRDISMSENGLAIALYLDYDFVISTNPEISSPYFECMSFTDHGNDLEDFDDLRVTFAEAFKSFYKNESQLSVVMRSKLTQIMSVLYTHFYVEDHRINFRGLDRIRYTINYIYHNFKENITLTELAENVNLSTAYLSRMFKSTIGQNVTEYIAQLRMNHAIKLFMTDKNITEIAYESGFSNPNAMIATFNKYKDMTPGEYRKRFIQNRRQEAVCFENKQEFSNAFETLLAYIPNTETEILDLSCKRINVSSKRKGHPINKAWKQVLNVGYASSLLNIVHQNQVRNMQANFKFKYFRVKGILDDDMFIQANDGSYHFGHVFKSIDFILEMDAIPMIEIGHMPEFLSNKKGFNLRRESTISVPKNYAKWEELLEQLFLNLYNRYGDKMNEWIFSPWVTMEYIVLSPFNLDDYLETYQISYDIIKRNLPEAKIMGPGMNINNYEKLYKYLDFIKQNNIQVDLFSFKSYAAEISEKTNTDLTLKLTQEAFPFAVSKDEDYLKNASGKVKKILNDYGYKDPKIIIEEWNSTVWQRDYCSDTIYKSCYIVKNILENQDNIDALSYYSLSDTLNEVHPSDELFSGGFGLFTWNNIPKSGFYALKLLNRAGDEILDQGDSYCVIKGKETYQLFVYNYTHYDMLYRYRHASNMSTLNRYEVFNYKETMGFNLSLKDLHAGKYKITYHCINEDSGSPYDIWLKMGAPRHMSAYETEYLNKKSIPGLHSEVINVKDVIDIKLKIDPLEVVLVEIQKI